MTTAVVVIAFLLLVIAGWLRAAGTAITRIPRADALRDQSDGVKGAATVAELLDDRETISPAVGVVASILLVVGAALAAVIATEGQDEGNRLAVALGMGILYFLLGDLVARWIGRIKPAKFAYRSHRLLRLAVALGGWANELLPEELTEDDLAEETSEEHERELIDSVLEFGETFVREVMTPRPDMVTIPVTGSIEELIDLSTAQGYSRIPVTSNGDVVGVVIVKDLLSMLKDDEQSRPSSVAEVMRPVEFIPENKLASSLLAEMQESHSHQAIVVDEFGDIAGLVTIEDLLEELVGEIADETDSEEALIRAVDEHWVVDARMTVDDFCRALNLEIEENHHDTVGGMVMGLAERVPLEGERFEIDTLSLTVSKMQGRRVSELTVALKASG